MAPASQNVWWQLLVDLNIDVVLNPFIPRNPLKAVPRPISRWLGYRDEEPKDPPAIARFPIVFLATVAGLCLVGGIFNYSPGIKDWHPPILIASLGASAILDYNSIRSPLSQPRNTIVGQTVAAIVGVGISKLFQHSPDFANLQWLSGAVGCACASIVMSFCNCLHPPGGATAVLASADAQVIALGWRFVPLVLLASTLMMTVACIFNNIARQYPVYWWTPEETGQYLPYPDRRKQQESDDAETFNARKDLEAGQASLDDQRSESSNNTLRPELSRDYNARVLSLRAQVPADVELSAEEADVLERLEQRMRARTATAVA